MLKNQLNISTIIQLGHCKILQSVGVINYLSWALLHCRYIILCANIIRKRTTTFVHYNDYYTTILDIVHTCHKC